MIQYRKTNNAFQNRKIIFIILFVLGILLLFFNDMGIVMWYQLHKERNQIQAEIKQLIIEENVLTNELELLKNDGEYIKKIARERFNMVKSGEKLFRVLDKNNVKNK